MPPSGRRPHGSFLAGEAGELAGVPGTTIGQWARRGLIRSSVSDGEPRRYAVEDVAEAAIVAALLARGLRHVEIHRAIDRLGRRRRWPLSAATLATTVEPVPRIVLRDDDGDWVLTRRGWQRPVTPLVMRDVHIHFG